MFRTLSRLISTPFAIAAKRQSIRATPVRLPVRAKYDSAQTNADNRRHWAMADGLSAAAANSPAVRSTLRNRARYEYANNTYYKGIIDTLCIDSIGYGPSIQVTTGDPAADKRIKTAFERWAREIRMASKLRTMRRARAVDGEAFAVLTSNNQLKSPIKLDVRLIEADQVTDPSGESNNADGIKFDDAGNPVSYSILKEHPGGRGVVLTSSDQVHPTPARDVIHWFTADRPGKKPGAKGTSSGIGRYENTTTIRCP